MSAANAGQSANVSVQAGLSTRPGPSTRPIESILAPVDYSEASLQAAELALAMARGLGASLTLLHLHISDVAVRETVTIDATDVTRVTADALLPLVRDLAAGSTARKLESDVPHSHAQVVKAGYSREAAIIDFARANDIGLIVIGARVHSKLHTMLLGDVAKGVIEHAERPVMVLHS